MARLSKAARENREAVAERDSSMCVKCGRPVADIHEIIPRSRLPKDPRLFSLKNMVCLCRACHSKLANTPGRRELFLYLKEKYGYDYSDSPFDFYLL